MLSALHCYAMKLLGSFKSTKEARAALICTLTHASFQLSILFACFVYHIVMLMHKVIVEFP